MKKLLFATAMMCGFVISAQQFGAKAGANISTISNDGFANTTSKTGFYIGGYVNIPISKTFSIQPEAIYNNLGTQVEGNYVPYAGIPEYYTRKIRLNYISIPIMFQYKATQGFYVEAGPQISFMVAANTKTSWNDASYTSSELSTSDFNSVDLGIGLGIGYNFTPNFGINTRYVAGLTDVTKSRSDPYSGARNKNNNFQIGLYYGF